MAYNEMSPSTTDNRPILVKFRKMIVKNFSEAVSNHDRTVFGESIFMISTNS